MGRGGNVWEWDESSFDLINSSGSSFRGGDAAAAGTTTLAACHRLIVSNMVYLATDTST
jgi:hypothetical protein